MQQIIYDLQVINSPTEICNNPISPICFSAKKGIACAIADPQLNCSAAGCHCKDKQIVEYTDKVCSSDVETGKSTYLQRFSAHVFTLGRIGFPQSSGGSFKNQIIELIVHSHQIFGVNDNRVN